MNNLLKVVLGRSDELAVLDGGPSQAGSRYNIVAGEKAAQPWRRVLIKQDADGWRAGWHYSMIRRARSAPRPS
jgi:hypothetical protein